ncbi:MAG: hypothetical protein NWE93_07110 [Candidatus Bathyarchaeota archaeon]|nr:hypothetical protein [Candidatus Bathyarchaeota archaeon]
MSIAHTDPFLYIVVFIVIFVVFIAAAAKIPSLRRPTKRNLLIYLAVALALSLPMYQAYDASLGVAAVTYHVEAQGDRFYADRASQFTFVCTSLCRRATSFNLLITTNNATFEANPDYTQLNDTAIKLPLSFQGVHREQSVSVLFRIDESVAGCDFTLTVESENRGPIVTASTDKVYCVWNSTLGCYLVSTTSTPCVL